VPLVIIYFTYLLLVSMRQSTLYYESYIEHSLAATCGKQKRIVVNYDLAAAVNPAVFTGNERIAGLVRSELIIPNFE